MTVIDRQFQKVSIAISTKDNEEGLLKLLSSLNQIDYPKEKIEIVIVEEGDRPKKRACDKYIFIERKNLGFGYTRKVAIENCSYEYVEFVYVDCVVDYRWLKHLVAYMDNEIGGVTGAVMVKDTNATGLSENILGFPGGGLRKIYESKNRVIDSNEIVTCNALIKKNLIKYQKIFENIEYTKYGGEDSLISMKIKELGYRILFSPKAIVYHEPKKNLFNILKWAVRMGKSRVFLRKLIKDKDNCYKGFRNSILFKLAISILMMIYVMIYIENYFQIFIFVMISFYWLKSLWNNKFFYKYYGFNASIVLILPLVKLFFELGIDYGQKIEGPVELFRK